MEVSRIISEMRRESINYKTVLVIVPETVPKTFQSETLPASNSFRDSSRDSFRDSSSSVRETVPAIVPETVPVIVSEIVPEIIPVIVQETLQIDSLRDSLRDSSRDNTSRGNPAEGMVAASTFIVKLEVETISAALSSWMVVVTCLTVKPHPDWSLVTENLEKHCREWPAGKTESDIKLLIQENSKPQDLIVYTDGSITKDQ